MFVLVCVLYINWNLADVWHSALRPGRGLAAWQLAGRMTLGLLDLLMAWLCSLDAACCLFRPMCACSCLLICNCMIFAHDMMLLMCMILYMYMQMLLNMYMILYVYMLMYMYLLYCLCGIWWNLVIDSSIFLVSLMGNLMYVYVYM